MKAENGSTWNKRSGMSGKLMAALGLVLGMASLPAMAQTAPEPADRLCTAGFNVDYGWFNVLGSVPADDRFGVLEFLGGLTSGACVPITPARLAVQLGGTALPLSGEAIYNNLGSASPTLTVPLLEPALCEDYYSGAGTATWNLVIKDANDQDMIGGPVVGITALDYNLNSGALVPQRADASTPWLTCHAGLAPNSTAGSVEPDENGVFADGLESETNLRVAFLDVQGAPLASDVLNQAQAAGSNVAFTVRVSNHGSVPAQDVRIREFVPTASTLMGPIVERVVGGCIDHGPAGDALNPCSNTGGNSNGIGANRFAQNIGPLAPGAHRDFTLTRRSNGSDFSAGQPLALIQVAAFSAPGTAIEVDRADNSRSLRIRMVENESPTAHSQSVSTPEETSKPIVLTATDPDSPTLTFQVASQPSHGTLTGTAPNLTYTPALDYPSGHAAGTDSFTFTASDGITTSAPATVTISVTPVNDEPRYVQGTLDDPYPASEGQLLGINLTGVFTDPEGDAFTLSVTGALPTGVQFYPNHPLTGGPAIAGSLSLSSAGSYPLTVMATETSTSPALSGSRPFTLVIANVNQAPTVSNTPLPDRADNEGVTIEAFSLASGFTDPDPGTQFAFTVTGDGFPQGISVDENGIVSGTLSQMAAGVYTVTIIADDQQGDTVSDDFVWTVNAVNVAPERVGTLADRLLLVGQVMEILGSDLQDAFFDPDGDPLTITVAGLPLGVYLLPSGNIGGAPVPGSEGDYPITVTATDTGTPALSETQTFTIRVE